MLIRTLIWCLLLMSAGYRVHAQRMLHSEFDTTVFAYIGTEIVWDTLKYPYNAYQLVRVANGSVAVKAEVHAKGWVMSESEGIIVLGLREAKSKKLVAKDTFYMRKPPYPRACVGTYCESGRVPLHYLKAQKGLMVRLDGYRYRGFKILSFDVIILKGKTAIAQAVNRGRFFEKNVETMLQELKPGMKVVFQVQGAPSDGSVRILETLVLEVY